MDYVRIRKLQLSVFLGAYAEEQAARRPAVVDIELGLDLSRATTSDSLADTVDYDALSQAFRAACCALTKRYALVERLAGEIADICLAFDPRIETVRVTVGKPGAVASAETVEVEIFRSR